VNSVPPGKVETPNSRIQQLMAAVGMPSTAAWVEIRTREPISKQAPVTWFEIEQASSGTSLLKVATEVVQDLDGYHIQLFGRSDRPPEDWPLFIFTPEASGGTSKPVIVQIWRQIAWVPGSPVIAEVVNSLHSFTKCLRIVGNAWTDNDLRAANRGLKRLHMIVSKPGPKPGTGAKYKTREEWHKALEDYVLPKQTRLTADDTIIAEWLGISRSLMFDLMERWGPKTMSDLREGRF
jgi:hypothetical protein